MKVKSEEGKIKKKKNHAPGFSMSRKGNINILYRNDREIISKNGYKK